MIFALCFADRSGFYIWIKGSWLPMEIAAVARSGGDQGSIRRLERGDHVLSFDSPRPSPDGYEQSAREHSFVRQHAPPSRSSRYTIAQTGSIRFGEHGLEELFGALQALLGEDDGLGLVHRVRDHAFVVEPAEGVPIEAFPRPPVVVTGEEEKRQHRFVDLVGVERHRRTIAHLLVFCRAALLA